MKIEKKDVNVILCEKYFIIKLNICTNIDDMIDI